MRTTRTPLARARGLGAAHEGVHHWWMQRVTAAANVALVIWLVASIVQVAGAPYDVVTAWIGQPLVAILLVLTVIATFYHAALGVQVIAEDYIDIRMLRTIVIVGVKLGLFALGAAAVFSVLKIAFTLPGG